MHLNGPAKGYMAIQQYDGLVVDQVIDDVIHWALQRDDHVVADNAKSFKTLEGSRKASELWNLIKHHADIHVISNERFPSLIDMAGQEIKTIALDGPNQQKILGVAQIALKSIQKEAHPEITWTVRNPPRPPHKECCRIL